MQLVLVPCFRAVPGMTVGGSTGKVVAVAGVQSGNLWSGVDSSAYVGISAPPGATGFRQLASVDARSFYLSGGGASGALGVSGFRYIANLTTRVAVPVMGQTPAEPGYLDARGIRVESGALYGTAGDPGYTMFRIMGSAAELPTGTPR